MEIVSFALEKFFLTLCSKEIQMSPDQVINTVNLSHFMQPK